MFSGTHPTTYWPIIHAQATYRSRCSECSTSHTKGHTHQRMPRTIRRSELLLGPTQLLSTKIDNLGEMEKSIPVEILPQTIRDAFLVARKLDIRYIWIDVLCIIQDSKEDWHSEARRMGAIYANSYFTIAATAAKHSREGFLWSRTLNRVSIPFRRNATFKIEGAMCFRQPSDFLRDHQEYALGGCISSAANQLAYSSLSAGFRSFWWRLLRWPARCASGVAYWQRVQARTRYSGSKWRKSIVASDLQATCSQSACSIRCL